MATKSKHKPVTLAKSATDFAASDVHETIAAHDDTKPQANAAKAPKAKAQDQQSAPADDVIAVYRSLAERSLDQARVAFIKARDEAETLSGKLEESSSALTGGTSAVQSYVVKAMQAQADDVFGYIRALTDVKTMSDAIELQSAQSRRTLDASLRQFKDVSALMHDMIVKASTPIRSVLPQPKS